MKVVIIEDEKLSAEHLTLLLQKIDSSIEVVSYIETVKAANEAFSLGLEADLLLVDIHLADGNCFEIFSNANIEIPIIFTTAYDQYALQAFKQNSIDYLLKPIGIKDLQFALYKYKKQYKPYNRLLMGNIAVSLKMNKYYKNRFLVKRGQSIDTIPVEDILYFETQESLSFIVTAKGFRYPIDYTLDQLETLLQPKDFFRINRQIIIPLKSIQKVESYTNSRLVISASLLDGDVRIVSRERVSDFKKWLNK